MRFRTPFRDGELVMVPLSYVSDNVGIYSHLSLTADEARTLGRQLIVMADTDKVQVASPPEEYEEEYEAMREFSSVGVSQALGPAPAHVPEPQRGDQGTGPKRCEACGLIDLACVCATPAIELTGNVLARRLDPDAVMLCDGCGNVTLFRRGIPEPICAACGQKGKSVALQKPAADEKVLREGRST